MPILLEFCTNSSFVTRSGRPMQIKSSLVLIDSICEAFETIPEPDQQMTSEIMRVIRAVAVGRPVVIMAGSAADRLLKARMPEETLLWALVQTADDSIPESAS